MSTPLTVVTFLWRDPARDNRGYVFSHDHVRVVRNMVARNLTRPHRFVCVTDDKIEGIETVPLDWRTHITGTTFLRLMLHRPDIGEVLGGADRILCLDLDVVVTGNIDHIVDRPEDVVFFRNPNFPGPQRAFYQTSIQFLRAGARSCIWEDFNPRETPRWVNWRFGGREQAWVSERLDWNEAYFDQSHGIYGAGRIGDWTTTTVVDKLPENACIVTFPGSREPSQKAVQQKHTWVAAHYR